MAADMQIEEGGSAHLSHGSAGAVEIGADAEILSSNWEVPPTYYNPYNKDPKRVPPFYGTQHFSMRAVRYIGYCLTL